MSEESVRTYSILGERVSCNIDLALVAPYSGGHATLHVEVVDEGEEGAEWAPQRSAGCQTDDRGFFVDFDDVCDARIDFAGREILCRRFGDGSAYELQHRIANAIVPYFVVGLGDLVIHASAVELDGYAVAFVGDSGRGKSTLASCLSDNGWSPVSDDACRIIFRADTPYLISHFGGFRLLDNTHLVSEERPSVAGRAKSVRRAGNGTLSDMPIPIAAIFVIETESEEVGIQALDLTSAFTELMAGSFALDTRDRKHVERRFEQVGRLVETRLLCDLRFPRRMSVYPELSRAIIKHISRHEAAPNPSGTILPAQGETDS